MSAYYVIGCDKKLKNLSHLNVGFEIITSSELKNYIKEVDFSKKYYYVSNFLMNKMLYDTDLEVINFDNKITDLENFINYLTSENVSDEVELFKFWSMFDKGASQDEFNLIYEKKVFDMTNTKEVNEDFDFNIKYVFI